MNNREKQKAKEYEQLESFINNTSFITYDSWTPLMAEQEPPDFMLNTGNGKVGIELTELVMRHHNGNHNPKALEAFQLYVLQQVTQKLNEITLPCKTVEVIVHFADPPDPQKGYDGGKMIQPLFDLIVDKVISWDCNEYRHINVDINNIPGIQGVRINSGVIKDELWLPENRLIKMSIHWVNCTPLDEVYKALKEKEAKLPIYSKFYSEVFLLLLGNRYLGSQAFEISDALIQNTILDTAFDRVFYYDIFQKRGLEFKVNKR